MKHESITTLWNHIISQLSGQQLVKAVQSDQKRKHRKHPIFWDAQGILFVDYLEKGQTINSNYCMPLLASFNEEIAKNRLQMQAKKVLFHQDNAPCHKSLTTMTKWHELKFELLPHPLYSLNLARSDYYLFADLKKCSRERDLRQMLES